jgi:hypothetical protein
VKCVSVILIAFPSNAERNSRKCSEKQKIHSDMQKSKVLDCFEINCICSSFAKSKLRTFLQDGREWEVTTSQLSELPGESGRVCPPEASRLKTEVNWSEMGNRRISLLSPTKPSRTAIFRLEWKMCPGDQISSHNQNENANERSDKSIANRESIF